MHHFKSHFQEANKHEKGSLTLRIILPHFQQATIPSAYFWNKFLTFLEKFPAVLKTEQFVPKSEQLTKKVSKFTEK